MQGKGMMWNRLPLLLGLVAMAMAESSRNELRVNYGASFTFAGWIDNAAQRWAHTYVINIPEFTIGSIDMATCSGNTNHCKQYMDLLETVGSAHQRVLDEWQRLNYDVSLFFPDISRDLVKNQKVLTRGGLVPELGNIFKFLFGSATDADYDILRRNLNEVGTLIDAMDVVAAVHGNNLTSYSRLMKAEFDSMQTQLDTVHDFLKSVTEGTANMVKSMETMSREVSLAMAYSNANCSEIIANLQTYRKGILALARGELSPDLLSPEEMKRMIEEVKAALKKEHPNYHLPFDTTQYFYNLDSFNVFRHEKSLFISINFPVTDSRSAAMLYSVSAFPLLYEHNVSHATILEDLPAYFAKTQDGSGYLEMSEMMMRSCKEMDGVFMCSKLVPKIDASQKSCTSALFDDDDMDTVHEKCRSSLMVHGLEPSMLELEPGVVLLTKINQPVVQCKKSSTALKECTQCVVKLPCECSINAADGHYMPENMQTCRIRPAVHEILVPTNLNLLLHFMNSSELKLMNGNSLVPTPTYSVPKTPKFSKALPDHFPELREKYIRLPLDPVMEKVKKDHEVMTNAFQAKAAQVRESENVTSKSHTTLWICVVVAAASCISLVMMIFWAKSLRTYVLVMRD